MSDGHTSPQAQPCGDKHAWLAVLYASEGLDGYRNDGRSDVAAFTVKAVGAYLAHYADGPNGARPGGQIRPGEKRMAAELDVGLTRVRAAVRRLIAVGFLQRTHRGCHGHAAEYQLALPAPEVGHWDPSDAESLRQPADNHPPSQRPAAANPSDTRQRPAAANSAKPAEPRPHSQRPAATHPGTNPEVRSGSADPTAPPTPIQSPLAQPVSNASTRPPLPPEPSGPRLALDDLADAYPGGWRLLERLGERLPTRVAEQLFADTRLGELVEGLDGVADVASPRFVLDTLTSDWPQDGVTHPAAFLLHDRRLGKVQQAAEAQRRRQQSGSGGQAEPAASGGGVADSMDGADLADRGAGSDGAAAGELVAEGEAAGGWRALSAEQQRPWLQAAVAQVREELRVTVRESHPMAVARAQWLWRRDDATTRPDQVTADDDGDANAPAGDGDPAVPPAPDSSTDGVEPLVGVGSAGGESADADPPARRQAS